MDKSCACILLQPCAHGCLAQLQTLAFSPVTFFVIFFFFSPQPLYMDESNCQSILETIQQAARSGSSFS